MTLLVRPIRHSHGELKGIKRYNQLPNSRTRKTYSTFPRGIESLLFLRLQHIFLQLVRPIRHSHGELKDRTSWCCCANTETVRPIRHSHGELKGK